MELRQDAQVAIIPRAGLSGDAFRDLELDHAGHGANACRRFQQMMQDRRGDVVRQIPEDERGLRTMSAADLPNVDLENVGRNHLDAPRVCKLPDESPCQLGIKFHGHHLRSPLRQQSRHGSLTWTDLDHQILRPHRQRFGNTSPIRVAGKEVLAEFGLPFRRQGIQNYAKAAAGASVRAIVSNMGSREQAFRWMDLVWLALLGFLAVLNPRLEIHKQLTLLAIGLFQIFDSKLLAALPARRRNAYIVLIKILLATILVGHTGGLPIASPYWLIYYVPVVSAATLYEARGTLLWTAVASAAYCSYLIPALKQFELTPAGETELALRVLFLFLAAIIVNQFATENRRQAERYRHLAEELADTNRRLLQAQEEVRRSERLAALGQLTAGVAHEIRNPLGVIKGSAEMLAQKISAHDALAGELAGYISTEVDRLNGIVSRFLDFARPLQLHRKLEEIPPLLDRSLNAVRHGHRQDSVQVERLYSDDLLPVPVDAELCEQVFTNLVLNAYQAMGQQGGTLRVSARPANSGGRHGVEIEFADTGPGVAAEIREQIFNPFFTTKRDGVGLGLSLVSRIIDEHGGSIRLASEPGEGARFRVFLPVD